MKNFKTNCARKLINDYIYFYIRSLKCQAKYCELPVECKCCGLTLVSAPHLARSYHHLFPLPVFTEVRSKYRLKLFFITYGIFSCL